MPRLFVAIDLPETVKRALGTLKTDIPTARWVKPEQMHLTLRFIGDAVPDEQVEPIKAALAAVEAEAFEMRLRGVGKFPPSEKKAPRVLWVGLDAPPALQTLHQQVEQALDALGFRPEMQHFAPHITLARLQLHKPAPEAMRFLDDHQTFETAAFPVTAFRLYASQLTPQGPRYQVETTVLLKS